MDTTHPFIGIDGAAGHKVDVRLTAIVALSRQGVQTRILLQGNHEITVDLQDDAYQRLLASLAT